jgi:hypothetical protein
MQLNLVVNVVPCLAEEEPAKQHQGPRLYTGKTYLPGAGNNNERLVEWHEQLTHAARMVAKKGVNSGHLWVIFVSLKEIALQLVWALTQVDAIIKGKYLMNQ